MVDRLPARILWFFKAAMLLSAMTAFFYCPPIEACVLSGFIRDGKSLEPLQYGQVYAFNVDSGYPDSIHLYSKTDIVNGKWQIADLPESGEIIILCLDSNKSANIWIDVIRLCTAEKLTGTKYSFDASELNAPAYSKVRTFLKGKDILGAIASLKAAAMAEDASALSSQQPQLLEPEYTLMATNCRASVMMNGQIAMVEIDFVADVPGHYTCGVVGGGGQGQFSTGFGEVWVTRPGPARIRAGVNINTLIRSRSVGNTFFCSVRNPNGVTTGEIMCSY